MTLQGGPSKFLNTQNLVKSQQLFYIKTEYTVIIVMTQKNLAPLQGKLGLESKMFGKGDGFSGIAETPSWREFCALRYNNYHQAKSFQ